MTSLECEHCGGPAIESEDDEFYQDEGESCITCGFPGCVYLISNDDDDETFTAEWSCSDDPEAACNIDGCEDCYEDINP